MLRCAAPLATLGVLAAATLQAQDRRLIERLDPVTATAVQQLVDSARTAALPTEPLVQKALEGATLGAGGDRIRNAVGLLFGQLGRARQALGSGATEAELTAGAGALRAGVSSETLQRLQLMRQGRPLVVPLSVLTDLVAEGMTADLAARSVFDLARSGRPDADFVALRRRVQTQLRSTSPREEGPPGRPPARPAADPPGQRP